jgi:segregation and condensation protein A
MDQSEHYTIPEAESDVASPTPPIEVLQLRLEGFEGPLDLLLDLARKQKVDLAQISILALVDQYLAVIEGARRVRLELAAEWLVMAAWLAWLKSRLLLPPEEADAEDEVLPAETLAQRLAELEDVRSAGRWLAARPQLGHDVFVLGVPEDHVVVERTRLAVSIQGLLRAYIAARRRSTAARSYRPPARSVMSLGDALKRLWRLVGGRLEWTDLERFMPHGFDNPVERRAGIAATLVAGLELARVGAIRLRQDRPFGPIFLSSLAESGTAVTSEAA